MDAAVTLDCEWSYRGRRGYESAFEPVVACAKVGGRTFTFWGRDDRLASFVDAHRGRVWVAHSVTAEQKYLIRLGVELPPRWFDTQVAHRVNNNLPGKLSASLVVALSAAGLDHLVSAEDKDTLRERIVDHEFTDADLPAIEAYCLRDVSATEALYEKLVGRVDPTAMQFWAAYLAAVSRMELRGVPLDAATLKLILQHRGHLCDALRGLANETAPVYRRDGSFSSKAFLRWARREGIGWPKAFNGRGHPYHSLADETMKAVEHRHAFIKQLRMTRKTLRSLNRFTMCVDGRLRRHLFSTMPFRSISGRNQPSKFIFGAPKWMRFLIVPPSPDHVLVYCDFAAQEFGVAAALSGDEAMREMYAAADPHLAFAVMAGAAPAGATKKSHPSIRDIYKTVNLAVLYGQTAEGIAERLGIEADEAWAILAQHKRIFYTFHTWSERSVSAAYDRGYVTTRCGWRATVPPDSKWRTWANFGIQATSADVMRAMTIGLDQQNVQVLAIVHDGWLLACHRDQLPQLREAIEYARRASCDCVLNGFELKMDVTVFKDRFEEEGEEAVGAWNFILSKLPKEKLYVPSE